MHLYQTVICTSHYRLCLCWLVFLLFFGSIYSLCNHIYNVRDFQWILIWHRWKSTSIKSCRSMLECPYCMLKRRKIPRHPLHTYCIIPSIQWRRFISYSNFVVFFRNKSIEFIDKVFWLSSFGHSKLFIILRNQ